MSRTIDIYCPTCGHMEEVERTPSPPVHVAVFDDGRFEFVRRFSVLAEAEAFKDGVKACPSLHSTGSSAYLLPGQEAEMHEWQPEARKALAAAEEEAR